MRRRCNTGYDVSRCRWVCLALVVGAVWVRLCASVCSVSNANELQARRDGVAVAKRNWIWNKQW